jgi:hypothetical protein
MKKRTSVLLLALVATLLLSHPLKAQPFDPVSVTHSAQLEKNVYADAVNWFRLLTSSLSEFAAEIDKQRFISYTTRLGTSFEQVITGKREIAMLLLKEPLDPTVRDKASKLLEQSEQLLNHLTDVSFQLKGRFKDDGNKIAEDLRTDVLNKNSLLGGILQNIGTVSPVDRAAYSTHLNDTADAMGGANSELAKLVAALSH